MTHRYGPIVILLVLFLVALTSQGCYTVLKMKASDIPNDGFQAGLYVDGPIDPFLYEYDYLYDPLFYHHSYYAYSYTGSYCSPWSYGCAGSYPIYCSAPDGRYRGEPVYDASAQNDGKSQRRRGASTTPDPSSRYRGPVQGTSSPVVTSQTTRPNKTLRRVDTTPARHEGHASTDIPPRLTSPASPQATPSFSQPSSSVPQTSKTTPASAKSSPPARRRGSGQ